MVAPTKNPPWSSTLVNLPAPARRSIPLKPHHNPRPSNRGELLAASLRRGFISSRVLHSRYATSTLSEFLGPVAPDRYRSLPHRSTAAAKALTAVALRKGLKEVQRLESFRRSGSLKLGLTHFRDEDAEDGDDCWFDGVAAALLGCRFGAAVEETLEATKTWTLGDNPAPSLRTAHLPLEAHCVEVTGGADYSDSIAPAAFPARNSAEPVDILGGKASCSGNQPEALASRESPSPDVVLVDKVDQVHRDPSTPFQVPADAAMATAGDGVEGLEPTLLGGPIDRGTADAAAKISPQDAGSSAAAASLEGKTGVQVAQAIQPGESAVLVRPVLFADPSSEKFSFDIDIVETTPKDRAHPTTNTTPASFVGGCPQKPEPQLSKDIVQGERAGGNAGSNGRLEPIQLDQSAPLELKHDPIEAVELPCNVRQDAPTTLLQEMLEDMNDENDSLRRGKGKMEVEEHRADTPMDVVKADAGNEKEKEHGLSQATKLKRARLKRKLSTRAVHDKHALEDRRDRMKATVMETLQGDAENKKKLSRPSAHAVNGHRSPRAPRNRAFQRRSSRRTRRSTAPTIDSSSSDSNDIDNGDDEEFLPLEAEASTPTLPKRTAANSVPAHSPAGPSNDKDVIVPRKRPDQVARDFVGSRSKPATTRKPDALVRDETGAIIVLKPDQAAKEREKAQSTWEEEICRIERILHVNDDVSPELSSAEEESELEPFDGLPLVERLVHACVQENRDVLYAEPFDEHGEMMRFYKETRNEPAYAPGVASPGTQFVEESWRLSCHSALDAEPDEGQAEENGVTGEGNMALATLPASAETQVKAAVGHTGSKVESGEGSSEKSDSSEEEVAEGGAGRKVQIKAKAIRAKELQTRVCGDLLSSMEPEARKRVLRWAEKDYSWFDDGADMMELVGSKTSRPCSHCDSLDGCTELRCEESILLKLWTNMKWRKVRRMRHRVRVPSA